MWTEEQYSELNWGKTKPINVRTPAEAGQVSVGSTVWSPAPEGLVKLAQAVINTIADHRHLKAARVLLLIKTAAADAKKTGTGAKAVIGKAAKANAAAKLLSRIEKKATPALDFVVWLNGVWLEGTGAIEFDEQGRPGFIADDLALQKTAALLDHELSHCGARIIGEFVTEADLDGYVQDLGDRHIETRRDVTDEKGRMLVRFYKTPKNGSGYEFCMRRHDLEEFVGVAGRHGPWMRDLQLLIDELKEADETLFAGAGK